MESSRNVRELGIDCAVDLGPVGSAFGPVGRPRTPIDEYWATDAFDSPLIGCLHLNHMLNVRYLRTVHGRLRKGGNRAIYPEQLFLCTSPRHLDNERSVRNQKAISLELPCSLREYFRPRKTCETVWVLNARAVLFLRFGFRGNDHDDRKRDPTDGIS
jgi:hypothetical protein